MATKVATQAARDWLNYGERAYGEKYSQAIDATGFEYGAVANFAWVAKAVEPSTRVESLSWTHHREVAALDPSDQAQWLERAEAEQWSVRELLKRRVGKQLPKGVLDEVAGAIGKGRREVSYRLRFAELHENPEQVRNVVAKWGSWHSVVNELLPELSPRREMAVHYSSATDEWATFAPTADP